MFSYWILTLFAAISSFTATSVINAAPQQAAFQYLTADSVLLDVYEYNDRHGLLEGYRAHILSPVCEDGLCYEAELDFEWDIIGKFIRFRVDPDKSLTKLDHVPFTQEDYDKLEKILLTESPSFIHLRRGELVIPHDTAGEGEVDAMTGATVKAVKKDMVEGAIYTCYTLWHIANGGIRFNIQQHSRQKLDEPLIRKLLARNESGTSYFVVENMSPAYFDVFLDELLTMAGTYDAFFLERMIHRIPNELLGTASVQNFFRQHFHRLLPASQEELIIRWEVTKQLDPSTLLFLTEQFKPQDAEYNHRIIKLIAEQDPSDKPEILKQMVTVLCEREIAVPPESIILLDGLAEQDRSLRKILKPLKKQ
ncbi:MAG: hypothetical protein KDD15_27520 [Lewinella sp.]|nr:hypothetical protein [Lewinella sp.]